MRSILRICMAVLLLTACTAPVTPTPTAAPPTAALPTAAPATSAPAATPSGPILPAPLYVLELGQVARIERDATTRNLVTNERSTISGVPPIATFAASPQGSLAYVVGDLEADRLAVSDGRGAEGTVRYSQPGHELSDLVFSPDGATIALRLLNNNEPADIPSGLYRIPVAGGAPELLQADDPVDDVVNPSRAVSGYQPAAYSPDGTLLLVYVQSLFYEDCVLGIMPAAGGTVRRIELPAGIRTYCAEAVWTPDSAALLFLAGPAEGPAAGPQLWRADVATGTAELLLGGELYARAPLARGDGTIRFFLARVERDASGIVIGGSFAPAELSTPGAAPRELGPAFPDRLERALWAPDGSGAVLELSPAEAAPELRWSPIAGEPLRLPSTRERIGGLAWGAAELRALNAAPAARSMLQP